MKNILITGGAGFIGKALTKFLYCNGYNITILDNLSTQIHGENPKQTIRELQEISKLIIGDVRDAEKCSQSIKNQDIIIHLAAETGTGQSMYKINHYNDVNIMGTSTLLESILNTSHNIQKLIIASSRAVYGEGKYYSQKLGFQYPLSRSEINLKNHDFEVKCPSSNLNMEAINTDELSKINPNSIYGMNKYQQEQMVLLLGKSLDISAISLRFQNVYGPGQSLSNPYTGILSVFSTNILNSNNIEIYEDGNQTRDFIYIDDVIESIFSSIKSSDIQQDIFNVGSGKGIKVIDVARKLRDLYNSSIEINISGRYRVGDIRHNFADVKKSKAYLGFESKTDFDSGIKNFVKWVECQDVMMDRYKESVIELKNKGMIK
ncbi:MAG: epimerase [Flavobacteriales bacterium]|nr:epimerase [Flavobacteriales bacterium]|tara:strand:+ start:3920 stop:5047 length:1128 start_codon:yes stop_codon:yes gene_type:complete